MGAKTTRDHGETDAPSKWPMLMTVEEVADVLRTTAKAVYEMKRRGQLPGVRMVGRRLRFHGPTLVDWLDHTCTPS